MDFGEELKKLGKETAELTINFMNLCITAGKTAVDTSTKILKNVVPAVTDLAFNTASAFSSVASKLMLVPMKITSMLGKKNPNSVRRVSDNIQDELVKESTKTHLEAIPLDEQIKRAQHRNKSEKELVKLEKAHNDIAKERSGLVKKSPHTNNSEKEPIKSDEQIQNRRKLGHDENGKIREFPSSKPESPLVKSLDNIKSNTVSKNVANMDK